MQSTWEYYKEFKMTTTTNNIPYLTTVAEIIAALRNQLGPMAREYYAWKDYSPSENNKYWHGAHEVLDDAIEEALPEQDSPHLYTLMINSIADVELLEYGRYTLSYEPETACEFVYNLVFLYVRDKLSDEYSGFIKEGLMGRRILVVGTLNNYKQWLKDTEGKVSKRLVQHVSTVNLLRNNNGQGEYEVILLDRQQPKQIADELKVWTGPIQDLTDKYPQE